TAGASHGRERQLGLLGKTLDPHHRPPELERGADVDHVFFDAKRAHVHTATRPKVSHEYAGRLQPELHVHGRNRGLGQGEIAARRTADHDATSANVDRDAAIRSLHHLCAQLVKPQGRWRVDINNNWVDLSRTRISLRTNGTHRSHSEQEACPSSRAPGPEKSRGSTSRPDACRRGKTAGWGSHPHVTAGGFLNDSGLAPPRPAGRGPVPARQRRDGRDPYGPPAPPASPPRSGARPKGCECAWAADAPRRQ